MFAAWNLPARGMTSKQTLPPEAGKAFKFVLPVFGWVDQGISLVSQACNRQCVLPEGNPLHREGGDIPYSLRIDPTQSRFWSSGAKNKNHRLPRAVTHCETSHAERQSQQMTPWERRVDVKWVADSKQATSLWRQEWSGSGASNTTRTFKWCWGQRCLLTAITGGSAEMGKPSLCSQNLRYTKCRSSDRKTSLFFYERVSQLLLQLGMFLSSRYIIAKLSSF